MTIDSHPERSVQGPDPANQKQSGERAFNVTRNMPTQQTQVTTPRSTDDKKKKKRMKGGEEVGDRPDKMGKAV